MDSLRIRTSDKVKSKLLLGESQETLANLIGITRQTLSSRLKNNSWKKSEIFLIDQW